ncbi:MAG: phosphatase PAP2 family protein [Aureispira sp.]|nr:phosphatase PAP2 family protein [Aureispira sp.]
MNIDKTKNFWKDNLIYFIGIVLVLAVASYGLFAKLNKGDMLIFFSGHRTEWRNFYFRFMTYMGEGYVYVLAAIALLFVKFRYSLAVVINSLLVLATSVPLKNYFQHERPFTYFTNVLKEPDLVNYVEGVVLHTSWTSSFPSGHTTSAFAFYSLLAFLSPSKWGKILCLFLAINVALSRMYLVQHFLKDVTAGALTGVFVALLTYYIQDRYKGRDWADRALPIRRIEQP